MWFIQFDCGKYCETENLVQISVFLDEFPSKQVLRYWNEIFLLEFPATNNRFECWPIRSVNCYQWNLINIKRRRKKKRSAKRKRETRKEISYIIYIPTVNLLCGGVHLCITWIFSYFCVVKICCVIVNTRVAKRYFFDLNTNLQFGLYFLSLSLPSPLEINLRASNDRAHVNYINKINHRDLNRNPLCVIWSE